MARTPDPLVPTGLGKRGKALWKHLAKDAGGDAARLVLAAEACRMADRLERLDQLLRGDTSAWAEVTTSPDGRLTLLVDGAVTQARQQAGALRLLLRQLADHPAAKPEDGDKERGGRSVDDLADRRAARRADAQRTVGT